MFLNLNFSTLFLRIFLVCVFVAPTILFSGSASAYESDELSQEVGVVVVETSGLLDPVLAQMMITTLKEVDPTETLALIFQVNIDGSVVEEDKIIELAELIIDSPVEVSFWVGPSGSRAKGPILDLAFLSGDIGISPGSRIGKIGNSSLSEHGFKNEFNFDSNHDLITGTLNYEDSIEQGFARSSPVLLEHLVGVKGFQVEKDEINDEIKPLTKTRFKEMGPASQFFHSVASPSITYLLFLAGMGLLVFELYTAGVGIAGVLGALCVLLGAYGLAVLPSELWAIGLLIFAMLGFAVDVQTGVPRLWTFIATLSLIFGSLFLFDGLPLPWLTLLFGILLASFCMAGGMPAMVRTRFATPTIGRDWIIGELGTAIDEISPSGTVEVKGAIWRAQTNRATPIKANDEIRVASVNGLWLDVEPIEGAARDYRERKPREK